MKIYPSQKRNFVVVDSFDSRITKFIVSKIPQKHRVFAEVWHVHEDWVSVLLKFVQQHGINVDPSGLPSYTETRQDPREDLFLTKNAPDFLIKVVWKALASHYHPDLETGDAELFMKFKQAYEKLKG